MNKLFNSHPLIVDNFNLYQMGKANMNLAIPEITTETSSDISNQFINQSKEGMDRLIKTLIELFRNLNKGIVF